MVTAQIDKSKAFASAEADLYASELWSGSTDVTQLDGTKIHAEVTFVQKVESGSTTMLHFTVQSGTVHLTSPPMSTAGCPETLDPVIHDIGPNDGSLSVTYDLATALKTRTSSAPAPPRGPAPTPRCAPTARRPCRAPSWRSGGRSTSSTRWAD